MGALTSSIKMPRFIETPSAECSICIDDYVEPRYLPCGHMFCTPCIQLLIDKNAIPNYDWIIWMFRCPRCRYIVDVGEDPDNAAEHFPRDIESTEQLAKIRKKQRKRIARAFFFVVVFLIIPFLIQWRCQYYIDVERAICSTEVNSYAASEQRLKQQLEYLTDKQKKDRLLTQGLENNIDRCNCQHAYDLALTKTYELEPAVNRSAAVMTLIDGKLLIANSINGELNLRDAYSVSKESNWTTIPSSTVAGMGICPKNGQVFVSTWDKHIFRFTRDGEMLDQWPVEAVASGIISVTNDCNVVLAVRDYSGTILIYSTYGEMISEIRMKSNMSETRLIKAVPISKGNFIVSYGEGDDPVHGIDTINANGQTLKTYDGRKGTAARQLNFPRDFVVDRFGNVLVVDSGKKRILLLDSQLKFLREIVSTKRHPFGILLNECETRLYVADNEWGPTKKKWTNGRIMEFKTN